MNKNRSEGEIIGAKLRKRAKRMHEHGASRDLIAVIIEAADRLARLGRENELLKRKIEDRGLFGPLSGVAIGLAPYCKYHDCHIVRTLDGGYRAIRKGEEVPSGWVVQFDVPRGTKAATIFSALKDSGFKIDAAPVGAKRKPANRKPSGGRVVRASAPVDMAARIAGWIGTRPVDLYREPCGGIRVLTASDRMAEGEYLGRFDEGATVQDLREAIEV